MRDDRLYALYDLASATGMRRGEVAGLSLVGYAEDHSLMFCDLDGGPLHPSNLPKRFDSLVRASALPRLRFP